MVVITRRLPNSHISRFRALKRLFTALGFPSSAGVLSPNVAADVTEFQPIYTVAYLLVDLKEAEWMRLVDLQTKPYAKLGVFVSHFIQVLKLTIKRAIIDEEGDWLHSDMAFYNLDSTGGNLPDLRAQEAIRDWAQFLIAGEADRLASRPTAVAMTNPAITDLQTRYSNVLLHSNATSDAALALVAERGNLDRKNMNADEVILRTWNFLDAHYSNLEDSLKRTALRQWGVVFVSQGNPNIITFLVKNTAGEVLAGATAIIEESGSEDIANEDGRIELNTTVLGPITIVAQFPGKQKTRVEYSIPDDAENQTLTLPDVVLEDNV